MSISFQCNSCKKKITAPDSAGGKWGKCPYCNYKCYVPLPKDPNEADLTLTPVDLEEEAKYKELMRETYHVTEDLLHKTDEPPEPGNEVHSDEGKLKLMLVRYLAMMAAGQLDEAQQAADKIAKYRMQAKNILEQMAVAEVHEEELQNIPPKVLNGFIRNMLTRLG